MSLDLITNPKNLKQIRARQKLEDDVKIARLKRRKFLKDQILNHDRIDLLMTEVLEYDKTKDFHLAMWYHRETNYRKKANQRWHLILAPRGGGKCVSASTKIQLVGGGYKTIKNISIGDKIISLNDTTLKVEPDVVIGKCRSGTKPVYELTLRTGKSIRATLDHRFRSINGWKKLKEFQVGERIATPRIIRCDGNGTIDELEAKSDIFWDEVTEIKYIGEEETYDIETAENHNFVAEDIFTHNSTCCTISDCILRILKNPNIRVLIASKTDDNARGFLSEIKQKLKSKKVIEIFGNQVGDVWNEGEINVAGRTSAWKEKTIETVGYTGALASKHFDIIYADDLVDEENSKTEVQRLKLFTWFYKILDPTLMPDGCMFILGTRYHPEDLSGKLIETVFTKKNKSGKVIKKYYVRIPALFPKKNCKPNAKPHQRYVSFWPEEMSVKYLLGKKKDQGSIIFASQYLNDVEAMKGQIFKVDWFQWYRLDEINLKELMIFQGVDLAISQKDNADKFAHCTIGVDPKTKNIYVLDYYNRITHYTEQKQVILNKFNKYDPIRVGIEANGYQQSLLQDMRTDKKLAKIRALPLFTETDKTLRAWKLSAYFERSQVYLLEGMHGMQEHLLKMPDGRYKDLFDSLDLAITIAFNRKKKNRKKEPGVI